MNCFEQQIEYNSKKAKRMLSDKLFVKMVERTGFTKISGTDSAIINELVDNCLLNLGKTRPTSLERACVLYQASLITGENGSLMSGFCLRKENQHYEVDKAFHNKKSHGREHASMPNFSYCIIDGEVVGIKEPMDFIDVVEMYKH